MRCGGAAAGFISCGCILNTCRAIACCRRCASAFLGACWRCLYGSSCPKCIGHIRRLCMRWRQLPRRRVARISSSCCVCSRQGWRGGGSCHRCQVLLPQHLGFEGNHKGLFHGHKMQPLWPDRPVQRPTGQSICGDGPELLSLPNCSRAGERGCMAAVPGGGRAGGGSGRDDAMLGIEIARLTCGCALSSVHSALGAGQAPEGGRS